MKHIWLEEETPANVKPEFDKKEVCQNCGMERLTATKDKISVYDRSGIIATDLNDYTPYCFNDQIEDSKTID